MEQTTNKRIKITFCGIKFTFPNIFACTNNCIVLEKDNKIKTIKHVRGLKIKFYGSNNIIKFVDKIPSFKNVKIDCGDNTTICINATKHKIKNLYINARSENTDISIDKDFSIESGTFDTHGEPNTKISIGKDCQFGCNIELDTADGHTIYSTNGEIINTPKDITIGDHVWLCKNVSVLKGAKIPNNSVIAKGSIVTKQFEKENVILAGTPAKIIKTNINWSRVACKNFNCPTLK